MTRVDDTIFLKRMREANSAYRSGSISVGELSEIMLVLRDQLKFQDDLWTHELTQHCATLDSASTWIPKDEDESRLRIKIIGTTMSELSRLVEQKLEELSVS